ncbi:hypothetical protein Tco_0457978 [Tanacetum coccineum]
MRIPNSTKLEPKLIMIGTLESGKNSRPETKFSYTIQSTSSKLQNSYQNGMDHFKHGFPPGYVELYDKHGGSFIVNGHRVKLYHDEEQINELTTEEIHLMCEQGKIKAIQFLAPFPANYRETMPWVAEKSFIYSVVENTCNEAKLYDLDETGKGIVKGNFLYVKKDSSKKCTLGEK